MKNSVLSNLGEEKLEKALNILILTTLVKTRYCFCRKANDYFSEKIDVACQKNTEE